MGGWNRGHFKYSRLLMQGTSHSFGKTEGARTLGVFHHFFISKGRRNKPLFYPGQCLSQLISSFIPRIYKYQKESFLSLFFFLLLSTTGGFRITTLYSYHKFWIFQSSLNFKHLLSLSLENIKILWKCKYFSHWLSEWIKSFGITDVWIYSVGSEWEFRGLRWGAPCPWLEAPGQQGSHPWARHWKVSSKCKLIIQRLVKKGLEKKQLWNKCHFFHNCEELTMLAISQQMNNKDEWSVALIATCFLLYFTSFIHIFPFQ